MRSLGPRRPWDNWSALVTDEGATFDRELTHRRRHPLPHRHLGHLPRHGHHHRLHRPRPHQTPDLDEADRKSFTRAYEYMDLQPGQPIEDITVDAVFLGSCTNGRIEDLRAAAKIIDGYHVATTVRAMVVPGSQAVKKQAEQEGLDHIFKTAGFEWREPGCSMCLGMNPDILSTRRTLRLHISNRNFEGRQGRGGRTHLLSPQMAAAAAITGHLTDVRTWKFNSATCSASSTDPRKHADR